MKRAILAVVVLCLLSVTVRSQEAEVLISLNEAFFESLLDSVFKETFEFSLARNQEDVPFVKAGFAGDVSSLAEKDCKETVRLYRQVGKDRSSIKLRNGKIFASVAFTGSYNPPLIGCIDFSGTADNLIELEYDAIRRTLFAKVKVLSVNLSGTGGVGGSLIARLIQGSIDRKVNPITVLSLDKLSFSFPVQDRTQVKMQAVGLRYEVVDGALNVFVKYLFE